MPELIVTSEFLQQINDGEFDDGELDDGEGGQEHERVIPIENLENSDVDDVPECLFYRGSCKQHKMFGAINLYRYQAVHNYLFFQL